MDIVRSLFRYGLVGILSNAGGYLVYLLITWAGMPPKTAMTILYITGATIGFFGNKSWTFSYKGGLSASALRYVVAHACGFVINYLMLSYFVGRLGYPHQAVQAIAIFVVAAFLFVTFKLFVFPTRALADETR